VLGAGRRPGYPYEPRRASGSRTQGYDGQLVAHAVSSAKDQHGQQVAHPTALLAATDALLAAWPQRPLAGQFSVHGEITFNGELLAVTTTAGPDVIAVAVGEPGVPDANSTHPTTKGDCPCPETNAA